MKSPVAAGLLAFLVIISAPPLRADQDSLMQTLLLQGKEQEEKDNQKIIDTAERMFGQGKLVSSSVFIKLKFAQKRQTSEVGEESGQRTPIVGAGQVTYLPGFEVPAPGASAGGQGKRAAQSAAMQVLTLQDIIASKDAEATISESVDKNKLKQFEDSVRASLGIDPKKRKYAGEFSVMQVPTAGTTAGTLLGFLQPKYLLPLLLGTGFLMFFFGPLQGALHALARSISDAKSSTIAISAKQETKSVAGEEGKPGAAGGAGGIMGGLAGAGGALTFEQQEQEEKEKKKRRPFSFIKEENIPNLIYLIQEEPPEAISLILTYLDPKLSAMALSAFPPELQMQVALSMAQVKLTSAQDVFVVEEDIRRKIDYLVGGLPSFVRTVEAVDNRTRREMLAALEKQSPRLARKAREELFLFEDIANLPDQQVQFILREIKTDQLATALHAAGVDNVMNKIMANLSEGGRARLREEIEYARAITPEEIEKAQRDIEDTIKKMDAEKKIVVRRREHKGIELEGRLQRLELSDRQTDSSAAAGAAASGQPQAAAAQDAQARALEMHNTGTAAYGAGKLDEAVANFQEALGLNPNQYLTWHYLGNCLYGLGRIDEAFQAYERSLQINPSNTQLQSWLTSEKQKRAAAQGQPAGMV